MIEASAADVAAACRGRVVGGDGRTRFRGASLDSRALESGQLFFALKGENHDGHDFVGDAIGAGAPAAVVAREPAGPLLAGAAAIVVSDTLQALADLAAWHRSRLNVPVIAVTGSTGKTTTKEMTAAILSRSRSVLASEGTENNEIGVPRTLLRLGPEHEACVLEFAMRGLREIAALADIARPIGGIVTNVAEAHIGRLRSRRRLAAAKAELPASLPPEGFAALNADDELVSRMDEVTQARIIRYGLHSPADVAAHDVASQGVGRTGFRVVAMGHAFPVQLAAPGLHNVYNALAAIAGAVAVGASPPDIQGALAEFKMPPRRGQIIPGPSGCTIVDDTYNASPASVRAMLAVVADMPVEGRRIVVLGDMLELGADTERAHRAIGRVLPEHGVSVLLTVGEAARAAADAARAGGVETHQYDETSSALADLRGLVGAGDLVLVKGSRRMAMEDIVRGMLDG